MVSTYNTKDTSSFGWKCSNYNAICEIYKLKL